MSEQNGHHDWISNHVSSRGLSFGWSHGDESFSVSVSITEAGDDVRVSVAEMKCEGAEYNHRELFAQSWKREQR